MSIASKKQAAGKILYVEDYEPAAMIMKHISKKLGHACVIAHSGADAVLKSQSEKYDLVLLDINLPDMDGWELAPKLRDNLECKIIGFTAAPDSVPDEHKSVFDEIEYKAFAATEVRQLIEKHLNF